jgi:hypothetical protein
MLGTGLGLIKSLATLYSIYKASQPVIEGVKGGYTYIKGSNQHNDAMKKEGLRQMTGALGSGLQSSGGAKTKTVGRLISNFAKTQEMKDNAANSGTTLNPSLQHTSLIQKMLKEKLEGKPEEETTVEVVQPVKKKSDSIVRTPGSKLMDHLKNLFKKDLEV